MTQQPPGRFESWTHEDELRWEIELLRSELGQHPTGRTLHELDTVQLEAEHLRLRRGLRSKLRPHRTASAAPQVAPRDNVKPRPEYTSPYSHQDIWERSG